MISREKLWHLRKLCEKQQPIKKAKTIFVELALSVPTLLDSLYDVTRVADQLAIKLKRRLEDEKKSRPQTTKMIEHDNQLLWEYIQLRAKVQCENED